MGPVTEIIQNPLPYADRLERRDPASIDLLVIHCTELPDLALAREYGERILYPSGTGNSGHYYIDRDGRIEQYASPERAAHHVRDYNARSIGIELVNRGRYPDWRHSQHQTMCEPYPATQIDSLVSLIAQLVNRFPSLTAIAGHQQLDTSTVEAADDRAAEVQRKLDPGPMFPWDDVLFRCNLRRWAA